MCRLFRLALESALAAAIFSLFLASSAFSRASFVFWVSSKACFASFLASPS
jgi:hypothetical protein